MSKDYELGRLAEELIQSRYKKEIERYTDEIAGLKERLKAKDKELTKEKESRLYVSRVWRESVILCHPGYYSYEHRSFDDITKEMKEAHEQTVGLRAKLKKREMEIRIFNRHSFWQRGVYKFSKEENN